MSESSSPDRPLAGYRVIDLSQVYSGPYATFLLAAAGAEVLKVEPPWGERRRKDEPPGSALPFAMFNAGKRSLSLDITTPEGRGMLLQLAATADVLVENYRPGLMEKLGLGREALEAANPRLICASISGFGSTGPYRTYPALDITIQAAVGVMASTGEPGGPPTKAGAAFSDISAGVHLYGAIVTALLRRERTGQAGAVEVAMLEATYPALASNLAPAMRAEPGHISRTGNRHGGMSLCPYNVYPAADGHVSIICTSDQHWSALTRAMGLAELGADPDLAGVKGRVRRMDEVDAAVAAATSQRTRDELFALLNGVGVPCGAVRELVEVIRDPALRETGMLHDVDHPEYGPLVLPASPLRFHGNSREAPPATLPLGADNAAIYGSELGLTSDQLASLAERRLI